MLGYVVLLGYVPLVDFWVAPSWPVGIWLAGLMLATGVAGWLLVAFSWGKLAACLVFLVGLHGAVWLVEAVGRPFEVDRCLDSGGEWRDEDCRE